MDGRDEALLQRQLHLSWQGMHWESAGEQDVVNSLPLKKVNNNPRSSLMWPANYKPSETCWKDTQVVNLKNVTVIHVFSEPKN